MIPVPIPANEAERLASLHKMQILSTPGEAAFDKITHVTQFIFKTPVVYITIMDEHRQWFKSAIGLGMKETSREESFCAHVVYHGEIMVIENAAEDERFVDHPAVCSGIQLRFYAGRPLRNYEGFVIGTLCIVDNKPRSLTAEEIKIFDYLGSWVESVFSGRGLSTVVGSLLEELDAKKRDSMVDPLLNVWNRRAIMDIFKKEADLASRQQSALSVLMIDVDNFKQINDVYGHGVGDRVLARIADTLRLSLRTYDSVGRYGGEEFLIILPHTELDQGLKLAERLRAEVASQPIPVHSESIHCTISIGIRSLKAGEEPSLKDSLIADADHALLRAKDLGKNRVEQV